MSVDYDELEKKRFGRRLTKERLNAQVTQRELAQSANIRFQELNRYEKGIRMPREAILNSLAKALVTDPNYLRYGNVESPFYIHDLGDGYGKEYVLHHLYSAKRKVNINKINEKLKQLDEDQLLVILEMAENLYLDSHPEELKEKIKAEEASAERLKESIKRDPEFKDKMAKTVKQYHDDFYRLFPEKYDEYLEGKKSVSEADAEIRRYVAENYPDLIEKMENEEKLQSFFEMYEEGGLGNMSYEDRYPLVKYIHSKLVPELHQRMQKDLNKRPGSAGASEVFEANRYEHMQRVLREGRLKAFNVEYLMAQYPPEDGAKKE